MTYMCNDFIGVLAIDNTGKALYDWAIIPSSVSIVCCCMNIVVETSS